MITHVWIPMIIWVTIGCLLPDKWILNYFGITSVAFLFFGGWMTQICRNDKEHEKNSN